jgi:uncharacterized OB-fold protein
MSGVRYLPDGRPRPDPSELTEPFWESARRHVLVRQRCRPCGQSFFTPQIACPGCLSEDVEWTPSSGRGVVYSYTVCSRAPTPGFAVPYVLAIVDLEDGWSMLANVEGCDPGEVRMELPVRVAWRDLDDEICLPVFVPERRS